jgi:hypothetical protein
MLVAFEVYGGTREEAEAALTPQLQPVLASNGGPAECWWVAEDDRHDGSDNDSAVFVTMGMQPEASSALFQAGLTAPWNIATDDDDSAFVRLYRAVAACEAPEGTQLDGVLAEFQDEFNKATR